MSQRLEKRMSSGYDLPRPRSTYLSTVLAAKMPTSPTQPLADSSYHYNNMPASPNSRPNHSLLKTASSTRFQYQHNNTHFRRSRPRGIFEHIQQDDATSRLPQNITFEMIDKILMPEFLQSGSCNCLNTLETCETILSFSKSNPAQLKKQYQIYKRRQPRGMYEDQVQQQNMEVLLYTPKHFPQVLQPQIQNLVRILCPSRNQLAALCSIVSHAKLQHLSFWLFVELRRYWQQVLQPTQDFRPSALGVKSLWIMIQRLSADLHPALLKQKIYVDEEYKKFMQTLGCSLIPFQRYVEFLRNLGRYGKEYPTRVFYAVLLYLKDDILIGGKKTGFLEDIKKNCWKKVLEAAANPLLSDALSIV